MNAGDNFPNLEMNKSKQSQPVVTYKRMVLPVLYLRSLDIDGTFRLYINDIKSGRMNSQLLQTSFPSVFVDKEIWSAGKCICIGEHIFPTTLSASLRSRITVLLFSSEAQPRVQNQKCQPLFTPLRCYF